MQGFYGIADAQYGALDGQTKLLIDGGACAVQLRCKGWSIGEITASATNCHVRCKKAGIPLIINDHILPDFSDGAHLGQDDGGFVRDNLPRGFLIGRSTHNTQQLEAAINEKVDYAGFGPVFPTGTKNNAGPTVSLDALTRAATMGIAVIAIGGITLERLPEIQAAGIRSWTAISAIWEHKDPITQIRAFSRA